MSLSYPRKHGGTRLNAGPKVIIQSTGPKLEEILQDVCEVFDQPVDKMMGPGKKEEVMTCKRIYCYVSTVITNATFKAIGAVILKDHTTVMHHRAHVLDWMSVNDPTFMETWEKYTKESKIWGNTI